MSKTHDYFLQVASGYVDGDCCGQSQETHESSKRHRASKLAELLLAVYHVGRCDEIQMLRHKLEEIEASRLIGDSKAALEMWRVHDKDEMKWRVHDKDEMKKEKVT